MKNIYTLFTPLKIYYVLFCLIVVITFSVLVQPRTTTSGVTTKQNGIDLLSQNWTHMPAVTSNKNQLQVAAADFTLVRQDGSGGQSNPPLNLYGTHIVTSGYFELLTTLDKVYGDCSLQLYDKPPIIADEFRIESTSLRLTITPRSMRIAFWSESGQSKSILVALEGSNSYSFSVQRSGDTFIVTNKGKVVATVGGANQFSSGKIWLGVDSTQHGCSVTKMRIMPVGGAKLSSTDQAQQTFGKTDSGLRSLLRAIRPDFSLGAAMALGLLVSDTTYQNEALNTFGSMTPENAMKWQFVEPKQGLFTYQEADAMVAIAQKNGIKIHGHTLVFGEANPSWVNNMAYATPTEKIRVKNIMNAHIRNVVDHFKHSVDSWDVVNEPLADYDNFNPEEGQILRNSIWYRALGQDYIAEAFKTAHAASPKALLYINEYGLEQDGERWDSFLSLIKSLKSAGAPIDGVGFQAHVYESNDKINTSVLEAHINQLARLGIQSRISEMDVYDDDGTAFQAQQYSAVFAMCLKNVHCTGFTTWGVDDAYDVFQDNDQTEYGHDLLFNNGRSTLAYELIRSKVTNH